MRHVASTLLLTLALGLLVGTAHADDAPPGLAPTGPSFPVSAPEDGGLGLAGAPSALGLDGSLQLVWATTGIFSSQIHARHFDAVGTAPGATIRLDTPSLLRVGPALARLASGRFAVAWTNTQSQLSGAAAGRTAAPALGDSQTASARLLGPDGTPLGPELRVDQRGQGGDEVRLAPLLAGGFAVSWIDQHGLVLRLFDGDGVPRGDAVDLATQGACPLGNVDLAALFDGGFLALWQESSTGPGCLAALHGQRFAAGGQPAGAPFQAPGTPFAAAAVTGRFAAVRVAPGPTQDLYLRLYGPDGTPLGSEQPVVVGDGHNLPSAIATGDAGSFLVLWNHAPSESFAAASAVHARLFDAAGYPTGGAFAADDSSGYLFGGRAASRGNEWAITWVSQPATGSPQIFARRFSSCSATGTFLCLQDNRFQVAVAWRDPRSGNTGTGQAVHLTADTGAFWFFTASNLELMVKVLDGRGTNGHFWVFYGGLSDVEYTLIVTDLATNAQNTYRNPPYTLASHADTQAF